MKINKEDITSEIINKTENKKEFEVSLMGLYNFEDLDLLEKIYNMKNVENDDITDMYYNDFSFCLYCESKNTKTTKKEILEVINDLHKKHYPIEKKKKLKEEEKEKKEQEFDDNLVDIENAIMARVSKRLTKEIGSENAFLFLNNKDMPLRINANHRVESCWEKDVVLAKKSLNDEENENIAKETKEKVIKLIDNNKYIETAVCDNEFKHRYKIGLTKDAKEFFDKVAKEETDIYYKENRLSKKTHKKIKRKNKLTN